MAGFSCDQVVTRSKYYASHKEFLSLRECDVICSQLDEWEDYVSDLNSPDTDYTGLTAKFSVCNWLTNPDIESLNIPDKLFNLPEFKDVPYLVIQCWGNILRHGRGLDTHAHEEIRPQIISQERQGHFHNANIYLKGEFNTTLYESEPMSPDRYWNIFREEHNEIGQLALFSSDLEHSVPKNPYETPRYSIALDIYPTYGLASYHNGHPLNLKRFRTYRNSNA